MFFKVSVLQYLSKLLLRRPFRYFVYFNLSKHVTSYILKLVTKKVYQGMWNLFKIDNKDMLLKKEHDKEMFIVHLKKVLNMLKFVTKESSLRC